VKRVSITVWEMLKHTKILVKIVEEETLYLEFEYFLTLHQSPKKAECKNAKYNYRCNEEHNKQCLAHFLATHEKIVIDLLNPMQGW
jgi:hypothetical protein